MSRPCRKSSPPRRGSHSPFRAHDPTPESEACSIERARPAPMLITLAGCGVRATDSVSSTSIGLPHAYSSARFRRPRTRTGVEDRSLAAGHETLVRAGQCRHRAGSRMRGARCVGPCRGDRVLQAPRGRSRRGRSGNAAGGWNRRRSDRSRHQGVRAEQASLAAGGLQGIYQGALYGIWHSDRRLWPLLRCGRSTGLCPRPGRADRGQGRWACRGQGRGGRSNLARSRRRGRHDVRWRVRCGGRRGRDRGVSRRPRDQLLCAVRWRDRDRARLGAGPQAGVRSRPGAEHRRHGGLFADAVRDAADPCRDHGEDYSAHGGGDEGARHAVSRRAVCRRDADAGGTETVRIQCPLRRSGMPGADAADDVGYRAGDAGVLRRAVEEFRSALVSGSSTDGGDGGEGLSGRLRQRHPHRGAR